MANDARLQIVIDALNNAGADLKALQKDLGVVEEKSKKASFSLKEFVQDGDKLKSVGNKMTVGVTLPLMGVAVAATKLASDLGETRSKVGIIFGEMSGDIQKWADSANTTLGQTRKQALDAASDFAIFGKSAGLAGQDLTAFAEKNVQLASDMASFFNTSPEEAITAIGAAFRGEAEPIRKYGVLINDAALKDEALRQGLIKTTADALTPQQRVLAASALIMKQTSDAQGDFARTSDGLANQTRIMTAQFQDALATLGEKFLPIAIKGVGVVRDLLTAFQGLSPEMQNAIIAFGALAAAAGPVMRVGGTLIDVVGKIKMGMTALGASAAPLALVVAGLVAIVAYLDRVGKAAQATSEDLIKMSRSGDIFDQAAASTELMTNGQNRLKIALDGVNAQLKTGAKSYADYRSSIVATAQAAGYQIDAEGNLIQVRYGLAGQTTTLVQANYALAESEYAANQAAYAHGGIVDNAVNGLINLGREAERYNATLTESATGTDAVAQKYATLEERLKETASILSPTQLGMLALAEANYAGGDAAKAMETFLKDEAKAAEEADKMMRQYREGVSGARTEIDNMSISLKNATEAQIKQALVNDQITALKSAYLEGTISAEELSRATNSLMINNGLATEKSILLAQSQDVVTKAFIAGKIPLETYLTSSDLLIKATGDSSLSFSELTKLGLGPASRSVEDISTYLQSMRTEGLDPVTGRISIMANDVLPSAAKSMSNLRDTGIKPTTISIEEQYKGINFISVAWEKVPKTVKTVYTIETKGEVPSGGTTTGSTPPSRALGGPTGQGGLFVLHPNEFVLSEAMRMGRAPIPAEAVPSRGVMGTASRTTVNNFYDSLATKMYLEQQRVEDLRSIEERM
jgi:hypothetical protein